MFGWYVGVDIGSLSESEMNSGRVDVFVGVNVGMVVVASKVGDSVGIRDVCWGDIGAALLLTGCSVGFGVLGCNVGLLVSIIAAVGEVLGCKLLGLVDGAPVSGLEVGLSVTTLVTAPTFLLQPVKK